MKKFALIFALVVLALGLALQFYQKLTYEPVLVQVPELETAIPVDLEGWEVEDLPLAPTMEAEEKALTILNFSDAISRSYKKGDQTIILYMAYWEPLRMPVRQVGAHTPDVCWIQNGWTCEPQNRHYEEDFYIGTQKLKPAQYGKYEKHGVIQHTYFWHIVGGKLFVARNKFGKHNRWQYITDFRDFGMNQQREQFFIRISSNKPFDSLWGDKEFQRLMGAVAKVSALDVVPDAENATQEELASAN